MSELVPLINHRGMPWPIGGAIGAIAGLIAGMPRCPVITRLPEAGELGQRIPRPSCDAVMPILEVALSQPTWIAGGTILGAIAGLLYQQATKEKPPRSPFVSHR